MSTVVRAMTIVMSIAAISPAYAGGRMDEKTGAQLTARSSANSSSSAAAHSTATSASTSGSHAAGGTASVVNNLTAGNDGGGRYVGRAPDVSLPSIGGGGMDCPTVGFGAGGSGLGGGGGFGPSWISPDCNARKLANDLWAMGYRDASISLLRSHFPEVDKAFGGEVKHEDKFQPSPWCATASPDQRRRNAASCGEQ